jgi:hypothetical protein
MYASNREVAGTPAGLSTPKADGVSASLRNIYERLELLERIFLFVDVDQLNEAIKNATISEITPHIKSASANDAYTDAQMEDTDILDSSLALLEAELQFELAAELSDQEADLEAELAKFNRQDALRNGLERLCAGGNCAAATRSNRKSCANKRATLSIAHHHVVTVMPEGQSTHTADVGVAVAGDGGNAASWEECCPLQLARLCEKSRDHICASQSCSEESTAGAEAIAVETGQPSTVEACGFVEALVGGAGGLAATGQEILTLLRENITQNGTFEEYRAAAFAKVFNKPLPGVPDIEHVDGALAFLFYNAPRMNDACPARTMSSRDVPDVLPVVVGSALADVD